MSALGQNRTRPIRAETRAKLVTAIAKGRHWLDELIAGTVTNVEQIATREKCSIRPGQPNNNPCLYRTHARTGRSRWTATSWHWDRDRARLEPNWVPTSPSGKFEVLFRFYGPEKPLFDKTWMLPDIERIAAQ
jgi:hypothetical protein